MRVLAIDTSAGTSVAVVESVGSNIKLLGEVNSENPMKHAETIGSAISDALAASGSIAATGSLAGKVRGIEAVVVGRGPAPFTGLRVGIAAAIMFAEGLNIPVYGVVSHDAIALAELEAGLELAPPAELNASSQLLVTSDARRSEVYWATYSGLNQHGMPIRTAGPAVQKPAALDEQLAQSGLEVVRSTKPIRAFDIARLFFAQQASSEQSTDVTALYLRAPDAVPTAAKKVSG